MLEETMLKIKEAEHQADEIVRNAEDESKKILEDAGKKAADMKQEVSLSGRKKMAQAEQNVSVQSEQEMQRYLKEAEEEIAQLRENAKQKEDEAVNHIISLLV